MMGDKKYLYWFPVLVWMGLIFYLSHQPAEQSSELSSGVMEVILKLVALVFPFHEEVPILHFLIRKAAHFFAYFMLGVLVVHALSKHAKNQWKYIGIALLICVLYAVSDEVHQFFIPGRSCEIRDMLIDSLGAAVGIGFYLLITRKPS